MKYLKTYENNDEIFDKNFEIGEIVYCIDNEKYLKKDATYNKKLELYKKYEVIDKPTDDLIQIKELNKEYLPRFYFYFHKNRFIHIKDIERWKLYNDIKKYNI